MPPCACFQPYESALGVVPGAYVLKLCRGREDAELDAVIAFIETSRDKKENWAARVQYEVRLSDAGVFMLCLRDATTEALNDLLFLNDVCSITGEFEYHVIFLFACISFMVYNI